MSPAGMQLFLVATGAIAGLTFLYWRTGVRRGRAAQSGAAPVLALVACGLVLCGWSLALERPDHSYARHARPLLIVIAFDLSPSMLAIPDPQFEPGHVPRFERARDTLLAFFDGLEEQQKSPFVSVIGFTREAEILMGWDQSTALVRDLLRFGLSPDLFGSSGTSIEAAVRKIETTFGMLPAELRDSGRELVILVSDGEDTRRPSSLEYALEDLRAADYDVIALQTGLLHAKEGVPVYGRIGEFLGFRQFSGRSFTVPEFTVMAAVAEAADPESGLHIRAERTGTVERMLQFAAPVDGLRAPADATLHASLGMFLVVAALCARLAT